MTTEQADELRRIEVDALLDIAAALKKLADRPVVLPNGYVWDEQIKNWAHPDRYAERRSS